MFAMSNAGTPQLLNPKLLQCISEFSDWWAKRELELDLANKVKEPLFHFTDMKGIQGILDSEEMWFTSIFHLNDPSELSYGIGLALDVLHEKSKLGAPVVKAFCAWMAHVLVKAGGEIFGFFVASFSRVDDDLGQWRAYADNGRGVAIGLAAKLFEVETNHGVLGLAEKTIASRVTYDRNETILNLTNAITRAIEILVHCDCNAGSESERQEFGKELARQLAVPIFLYAITSKHPAYSHESETRLLIINDLEKLGPITETRSRGSEIVPYIPSRLPVRSPGAITKIMIGPAARADSDHTAS